MEKKMAISAAEIIHQIPSRFQGDKAEGVYAVIQMNLSGDGGGEWYITIKDKTCKVETGTAPASRVVLAASTSDCVDLFTRKLDPMRAFMTGKVRLTGDMNFAMRLMNYFK
jgi:putative sterol carrier protein